VYVPCYENQLPSSLLTCRHSIAKQKNITDEAEWKVVTEGSQRCEDHEICCFSLSSFPKKEEEGT